MSKDPAFLVYPNDYLGGTMGFSITQHGSYWILLLYQFNNGHFPEEAALRILGKENYDSVKHKFKKDSSGLLFNQRLDEEIKKRQDFTASRRASAALRWGKNDKPLSGKKIDAMHTHCIRNAYAMRMGNGNEDENRNEIKDKKEVEIPIHLKEIWPAFLEVRNGKKAVNSTRALKMILTELLKISQDPAIQIKIIEQSIRSSWKDVYPLKNQSAQTNYHPYQPL